MLGNQINMGRITQAVMQRDHQHWWETICLWLREDTQRTSLNYAALALIYKRLGSWIGGTKYGFILNGKMAQLGWCPNQTALVNWFPHILKQARMLREWRPVLWGTEWVVVCLDPNTSLGWRRLQTAAAACGNHRTHANEIISNGTTAVASIFVEWTQLQKWQFAFSQAATSSRKGHLAGVNNPVCTAGRDWLEGGGQEGRDEHSLQPDDLFNYLGKTMSFCTHYTLTRIHYMTRIPLPTPEPPPSLSLTYWGQTDT